MSPLGLSGFLSLLVCVLVPVTLLLQLVALITPQWASYEARTELGKPKENGHYGVWTLCATKGPHWTEDCDPLDTFFESPPFMEVAGSLGIVHGLLLLCLLPLLMMRAVQVIKGRIDFGFRPQCLSTSKAALTLAAAILAILIATFASIGERRLSEYTVYKGVSFWIEVGIIILGVFTFVICAIENVMFWRNHIRQHRDPTGIRAETYGNPAFEDTVPNPSIPTLGTSTVAFTETSGRPFAYVNPAIIAQSAKITSKVSVESIPDISGKTTNGQSKKDSKIFTYQNPSFIEYSPQQQRHIND